MEYFFYVLFTQSRAYISVLVPNITYKHFFSIRLEIFLVPDPSCFELLVRFLKFELLRKSFSIPMIRTASNILFALSESSSFELPVEFHPNITENFIPNASFFLGIPFSFLFSFLPKAREHKQDRFLLSPALW